MTVAVLGGGIGGLSSAFYLNTLRKNLKVILIEGTDRLGGLINYHKTDDGTQFEIGARSLRVAGIAGANTLQLAESLDLKKKIKSLHSAHPASQRRLIKVNGALHVLPNSFNTVFHQRAPFSKSLFRLALQDLIASKCKSDDDSLYNFIERRFGTEIAKYLIDPMCRGIYAGNAKELSAKVLAKDMFELELKYRSIILGSIAKIFQFNKVNPEMMDVASELGRRAVGDRWSVWSLEGGLSTFVNTLESAIKNDVEIIPNCPISHIDRDGSKLIISSEKRTFTVDKVISCIPAYRLSPLVTDLNADLSRLLGSIPYVDVAVVNLEYDTNILKEPSFGYLIPSSQSGQVLGVIFDSVVFPQGNNRTILTVMMGGHWFESLFGKNPSEDYLLDVAKKEIESTLCPNIQPCSSKVTILRNCIPQYTIGHLDRVCEARRILETTKVPLYLAGNSYDGVGINDCIYSSKKAVLSII